MRRRLLQLATLFCAASLAPAAHADTDPLALARSLYNQRRFDAAITAADQARVGPLRADSADLIAARAYLERFRSTAASEDLGNARDRLRRLDPQRFSLRERLEYLVGLGEALFFDEAYGAAANLFASVVADDDGGAPDGREQVLDWWASALDRDARPRPEIERQGVYQRIRDRMRDELLARPRSTSAAYWASAAALGQGDVQGAWDAAQAGWVRATLTTDRGVQLRADLDRLVLRAIIPERAKVLAQPTDSLRQEWDDFKGRWTK